MHDGRNFLLEGPEVERIVGRHRHHGALVDQKLDLDDGTGRFAFVTDVRIDAWLTQSTKKWKIILHDVWRFSAAAKMRRKLMMEMFMYTNRFADKK